MILIVTPKISTRPKIRNVTTTSLYLVVKVLITVVVKAASDVVAKVGVLEGTTGRTDVLLSESINIATRDVDTTSVIGGFGTAKVVHLLGKLVSGAGVGNILATTDDIVDARTVANLTTYLKIPDNGTTRVLE